MIIRMFGFLFVSMLILAVTGCRGTASTAPESETISPSAKLETVQMLLEDLEAPRHPADGGGRAWLDPVPGLYTAGGRGRFSIVYEAGPEGIAEGGAVYFIPSPFWGWSPPQTRDPEASGLCRFSTEAAGVDLVPHDVPGQMVIASVARRALKPGERILIEYGAGPSGAVVDRFAEHDERLWIAVDGDGDGVRKVLIDSPGVDIVAGPPDRLHLALPGVVRPGETVGLTIAVLDVLGNAGPLFEGEVRLESTVLLADLPTVVTLRAEDLGRTRIEFTAPETGVVRIRGRVGEALMAESNPMRVSTDGPRVFWADLHGHSGLSDGTGTPEDYFSYARDIAALDIVALTDHDHWGVDFLDTSPKMWAAIGEQVEAFHEPGRFVTLLGYEWTSWLHGHRHVLYFDDQGEVFSSIDPRYDTPPELWQALRGRKALTIAHHTAGGPIATNWDYEPDPVLEPVTEVVSVHGSSEAEDSPQVIYSPVRGNFARDALERGYRLGFVGSGDSHDGHPGLAHLASGTGGLAGIMAEDLTRESILEAIRHRRVFATNGPRILLRMAADGQPMGSTLEPDSDGAVVFIGVSGTAPIERVDLVRSGAVVLSIPGEGRQDLQVTLQIQDVADGEYLYVRVIQDDGGTAWSSPVFFDGP
ncbi:MAG: CehA/McbA family metallohydrolase [Acidobacteria bacterium]|nr:CehA/McbA family metallohydrolase [Acidobacteriota bacterium]